MRKLVRRSHFSSYSKVYQESIREPETFWKREAQHLDWIQSPQTGLRQDGHLSHWFPDGLINLSQNCVDRHALEHPDRVAVYQESTDET